MNDRQTEEWNCGAAALAHLLERFNVRASIDYLDTQLGCTPEEGCSHQDFCRVLQRYKLRFISNDDSSVAELSQHLPAIVNFQCEGDGHYGVTESVGDDGLVVWDPWTGGNRWYSFEEWDRIWYSDRYGSKWWLHILLDQGVGVDASEQCHAAVPSAPPAQRE